MNAAGQCPVCRGYLLVPLEEVEAGNTLFVWTCHHCETMFIADEWDFEYEDNIGRYNPDSGDS